MAFKNTAPKPKKLDEIVDAIGNWFTTTMSGDLHAAKYSQVCQATSNLIEADRMDAARFYRHNIVALYKAIGADEGKCRHCGKRIWWVTTKSGKPSPSTVDGLSHFADCPGASNFRKRGK